MADGSLGDRAADLQQMKEITFSALDPGRDHTKKCSEETPKNSKVKLSFYTELDASELCEKSESNGVVPDRCVVSSSLIKSSQPNSDDAEERKKRRFDRYDSSESSDSGVAVLSSSDSAGCSGSDITEPGSPRSPESPCGVPEEGAGTRMPPWACEPAPAAPRRTAPPPAPARRPPQQLHRRITEYFNHKMKPHSGLKREASALLNEDTKKKCLPKNGVTQDLEKYISYLSQTLSPRLLDVARQAETRKSSHPAVNTAVHAKGTDLSKAVTNSSMNGLIDYSRQKDNKEKAQSTSNGFLDVRKHVSEPINIEKSLSKPHNGLIDGRKHSLDVKMTPDPSANGIFTVNKKTEPLKRKMPIPTNSDLVGLRVAQVAKPDSTKLNDVVSSTTKLDSKMNGVTCGSNNISLSPIAPKLAPAKRETQRKSTQPSKRTNRKSSACIANSKNLTWSKANNLKQVQLQKQNCGKTVSGSPIKNVSNDAITTPKINMNGVRQVPVAINGNLSTMNVPVTNLQNCHQINLQQQCNGTMNGTVSSNNLPSFVAVPQNVMLTTLRIPQNGIQAQTVNQHNNIGAFARQNVNVSSPTKLNGQFMFPFVQNLNGAVVQIPNLTKFQNFMFPQTTQLTAQRQDHMQNQQAAQFLINGTLLKLANTMTSAYTNVNKTVPPTSQSMPGVNKNVPEMPIGGMTAQPKPNYTVNISHPMLVSQSGFIVTSVPNINVKETWSSAQTNVASSTQNSTCSNPIVHHPPPIVNNFTSQTLHTSSIPIAPVKPPDNPIQGTDPPSSTVNDKPETESENPTPKCDIPWLTKTFNNNNVSLDSNKLKRPFAQVSNQTEKLPVFIPSKKISEDTKSIDMESQEEDSLMEKTTEEIRRVEEVARREETLFTQITVLKDVSSNVQNSLIESNYCSATIESSESGIGTDKSVDSPRDSLTSKECDEDSMSLSVSVCSMDVQSSQKSPILKQPKTLRFPPKGPVKGDNRRKSSTDTSSTVTTCLWENCNTEFENDTDLLEHLQAIHVESQAGRENYTCQWLRCKVKGKPSCSRLWLERHTLSHGGNKPFKCIVDGCGRRFSTQILLERHVNNHFNEQSPNTSAGKKNADSTPKLIRRNGKKLRYRRQPWSARMFDFFDAGMMEGLAWRLGRSTRWRLGGACPLRETSTRHTITLHATLTATRYNAIDHTREGLVTYYPPNVIEDEWVRESDFQRTKRVEIASLPADVKVSLYEQFCSSYRAAPSPPPSPPAPAPAAAPQRPSSSKLLNNLINKQRKPETSCPADNKPLVFNEEAKIEVSGAKKRKMGRKHGGNAFWPCGR